MIPRRYNTCTVPNTDHLTSTPQVMKISLLRTTTTTSRACLHPRHMDCQIRTHWTVWTMSSRPAHLVCHRPRGPVHPSTPPPRLLQQHHSRPLLSRPLPPPQPPPPLPPPPATPAAPSLSQGMTSQHQLLWRTGRECVDPQWLGNRSVAAGQVGGLGSPPDLGRSGHRPWITSHELWTHTKRSRDKVAGRKNYYRSSSC